MDGIVLLFRRVFLEIDDVFLDAGDFVLQFFEIRPERVQFVIVGRKLALQFYKLLNE